MVPNSQFMEIHGTELGTATLENAAIAKLETAAGDGGGGRGVEGKRRRKGSKTFKRGIKANVSDFFTDTRLQRHSATAVVMRAPFSGGKLLIASSWKHTEADFL